MSQNDAIPVLSRPPSSARTHRGNSPRAGSVEGEDSENNLSDENRETTRRIHDHSRPFPPPRLPTATSTPTGPNRTAPLTPLSSSFRSRTSARSSPETSPTNQRDVHSSRILPSNDTTGTTTPTPTTTPQQQTTVLVQSPQTPRSPIGEVSLTVPRPDGERTINEYVEAPFKNCCNNQDVNRRLEECPKIDRRGNNRHKGATGGGLAHPNHRHNNQHHNHHHHHHHHRHNHHNHTNQIRGGHTGVHQSLRGGIIPVSTDTTSTTSNNVAASATAVAVTKQPVSFTKEPAGGGTVLGSPRSYLDGSGGLSIMCDFCGRCRCESCREPPPLPSRWLCDNSCYCSPETVLDYASCLCCAKGLFYHCTDHAGGGGIDSENGVVTGSCADEPCSCTGNKRASRWACLGALTLVLPCLLCYWPLKGCVAVCEFCYARHASQGCRCNPNTLATSRHHPDTLAGGDLGDSRDPEKRLLDPVTPEL